MRGILRGSLEESLKLLRFILRGPSKAVAGVTLLGGFAIVILESGMLTFKKIMIVEEERVLLISLSFRLLTAAPVPPKPPDY